MTASTLPPSASASASGSAPVRLSIDHILADLELLQHQHTSAHELTSISDDDGDTDNAHDGEAAAEHTLLRLLAAFDSSQLDAPAPDADISTELSLITAFLQARSLLSRYSSAPSAIASSQYAIKGGDARTQPATMQLDNLHARVAHMQAGVEQRERNWSRVLDALGPASAGGLLAEFESLGRSTTEAADGIAGVQNGIDDESAHAVLAHTSRAVPITTSRRPAWDDDWESETLAPLPLPKELLSDPTAISQSPSAASLDLPSPQPSPSPVDKYYDLSPQAEEDDSEIEDAWALQDDLISAQNARQSDTAAAAATAPASSSSAFAKAIMAAAPHSERQELADGEEDEDDAWALDDTSVLPTLLAASEVPAAEQPSAARDSDHPAETTLARPVAAPVQVDDDDDDEEDAWALEEEAAAAASAAAAAVERTSDSLPPPSDHDNNSPATTYRELPAGAPVELEEDEDDAWALQSSAAAAPVMEHTSDSVPSVGHDDDDSPATTSPAPPVAAPVEVEDGEKDAYALQATAAPAASASASASAAEAPTPEPTSDRTPSIGHDDGDDSPAPTSLPVQAAVPVEVKEEDREHTWARESAAAVPAMEPTSASDPIPSPVDDQLHPAETALAPAVAAPVEVGEKKDENEEEEEDARALQSEAAAAAAPTLEPTSDPTPSVDHDNDDVPATAAPSAPVSAPVGVEDEDGQDAWTLESTGAAPVNEPTPDSIPSAGHGNDSSATAPLLAPVAASVEVEVEEEEEEDVSALRSSTAAPAAPLVGPSSDPIPSAGHGDEPRPAETTSALPVSAPVEVEDEEDDAWALQSEAAAAGAAAAAVPVDESPATTSSSAVPTAAPVEVDEDEDDDAWALESEAAVAAPAAPSSDPVPSVGSDNRTHPGTTTSAIRVTAPVEVEEDEEDAWALE